MLPDFFCSPFSVQQTTSGIDHRVKSFFGLATNTLNARNNNKQQTNNIDVTKNVNKGIFVISSVRAFV